MSFSNFIDPLKPFVSSSEHFQRYRAGETSLDNPFYRTALSGTLFREDYMRNTFRFAPPFKDIV